MAGLIGSLVVSNVSQTQSVGLDTTEPSTLTTYNHSWSDSYNTTSEIANLPRAVTAGIAVVFLSYMLVGVIGNLLTIIALLKCPRVRNVAAAFIISLCIADLLFCVFVLPWEVSRFLFRHWMWGEGLICTLFPLLRYWNIAASLLSIAMITINRYIMIAHYGVYNAIYKPVWIALMIAFCWVFPFTMLLPTLLGQWGRFGLDPRLDTCSIVPVAGERPKEVLFGIGFCVPALVIVVCYSLIFTTIRRSERRVQVHRGQSPALPGLGKSERDSHRKRNEWRITQMVLIIFLAFLFTYLPITLVKTFDSELHYPGLHMLGYVLIYMSSCANPVIYVIMNRQYRQAYRTVLMCRNPRLTSFTLSNTDRAQPQSTSNNHKQDLTALRTVEPLEEVIVGEKTVISNVSDGGSNNSSSNIINKQKLQQQQPPVDMDGVFRTLPDV